VKVLAHSYSVLDQGPHRLQTILVRVSNELPTFEFGFPGPLRDKLVAAVLDGTKTAWRAGHEDFWLSADYRGWLGNPDFTVNDDTPAVLQRFRLVAVMP
jgi:hypothetical protein